MSYCRLSSDDWQCDVYVWADVAGDWVVTVGHRHIVWDVPLPDPVPWPDGEGWDDLPEEERQNWAQHWATRHTTIMEWLNDPTKGHYVELPDYSGGDYMRFDTPGETADELEKIRAEGFNVPQYAIDALRAEQEESSGQEG